MLLWLPTAIADPRVSPVDIERSVGLRDGWMYLTGNVTFPVEKPCQAASTAPAVAAAQQ